MINCYKEDVDVASFHNESWFARIQIARSDDGTQNCFNLMNAKNNILPLRHHGILRNWRLNILFPKYISLQHLTAFIILIHTRILTALVTWAWKWQPRLQRTIIKNEMIADFPRIHCVNGHWKFVAISITWCGLSLIWSSRMTPQAATQHALSCYNLLIPLCRCIKMHDGWDR